MDPNKSGETSAKKSYRDEDEQNPSGNENQVGKRETFDSIKAFVSSAVTDDQIKKIEFFLLVQNFFKAKRAGSKDPRLSKVALVEYGYDNQLFKAMSILENLYEWQKPPTWSEIDRDEGILEQWNQAKLLGQNAPKLAWEKLQTVKTRSCECPRAFSLEEFVEDHPEFDRELEQQFNRLTDPGVKDLFQSMRLQQDMKMKKIKEEMRREFQREISQTLRKQQLSPELDLGQKSIDGRTASVRARDEEVVVEAEPPGTFHPERGESFSAGREFFRESFSAGAGALRRRSCAGQAGREFIRESFPPRKAKGEGREGSVRSKHFIIPLSARVAGHREDSSSDSSSEEDYQLNPLSVRRALDLNENRQNHYGGGERFLQTEQGAIKVAAGISGKDTVPPSFDGVDKRNWLGFKTQFELFLAGKKATSVEVQKRLLLTCLSGKLKNEFSEKYSTLKGRWFDLANYWHQLDKRFTYGDQADHVRDPQQWIRKNQWDGFEWTLEPFFTGVVMRVRELLGKRASNTEVSRMAARLVFEHGLPSQLLRELNMKIRNNMERRTLLDDINEMYDATMEIFKECAKCNTQVPWPQGKSRPENSSGYYFSQVNYGNQDQDQGRRRNESRNRMDDSRRNSRGEEQRRNWNSDSPFQPRNPRLNSPAAARESRRPSSSQNAGLRRTPEAASPRTEKSPAKQAPTPSKSATQKQVGLCLHCKKGNHSLDDCWTLHPEKRPPRRRSVSPGMGALRTLEKDQEDPEKQLDSDSESRLYNMGSSQSEGSEKGGNAPSRVSLPESGNF